MSVPGWLLKIVFLYLQNRELLVNYKGCQSEPMKLPGGTGQGTSLGMFLFLILINKAGFPKCELQNDIGYTMTQPLAKRRPMEKNHQKYFDDMSLSCSFNYKKSLQINPDPNQARPVNFRDRTGHILPDENNPLLPAWESLVTYVQCHDMKLNFEKTKIMLFNPGRKYDFTPRIRAPDGNYLEVAEQFKLLGVIIRTDLRWCDNTDFIFSRAMRKMWMLRNLKKMGGTQNDLLDIYIKHIRSIAEYAAPVWNFGLTKKEIIKLERIQKISLAIIEGPNLKKYKITCQDLKISTLQDRRSRLCEKMALKTAESEYFENWYQLNNCEKITRTQKLMYKPVPYKNESLKKSPILNFTNILNKRSI